MKIEYINPFVDSAIDIMKEMLNLSEKEIVRGQLSLKPAPIPILGVASVVGLTGDISGRVVLDMNKDTAVKIASIMNDEEQSGLNSLVRSTINELNNIISGRAVSILKNRGFNFDITPPSLFSGTNVEIDDCQGMQTLVIPLEIPFGEVNVNIALKEKFE